MKQDPQTIRVIIAHDQSVVREGFAAILNRQQNIKVVEQTGKISRVLESLLSHHANVLLMDLRLDGIDTTETIKKIRADFSAIAILIVSESDGSEDIYRALRAGARGYLLKDISNAELIEAIQAVSSGRRHISTQIATRLAERMDRSTLTARELEVLQFIVKGKSNKEIADLLKVTEGTVKYHVNGILGKLGVADRTQAATAALLRGIIHPQDL